MITQTEARNPNTTHIDKASTSEMLAMLQAENLVAVRAVDAAMTEIALAVDSITQGMMAGGRLLYIGAGTSGRLGVLDASECPPTFGVTPDLVVGIIAGGDKCLRCASEGAEDSGESGVRAMISHEVGLHDHVVGISAGGNAAYVAEALRYARSVGAVTVGLTSNPEGRLAKESDIAIVLPTGAEPITGSTRMKAGTAQKLVLNMLSTCAMIKTGKVYENLMINLRPTNIKLRARVISIVREILGCDEETAVCRLAAHDWSIRAAVEQEEGGKTE